MLPLHARGTLEGRATLPIVKVLSLDEALTTTIPRERVFVDLRATEAVVDREALAEIGFGGAIENSARITHLDLATLHSINEPQVLAPGDAIRLQPNGKFSVLYRRGANANSLFVTERCNSKCLMCSQPPRDDDDSWRIEELLELIPLIDTDMPMLGVTGGEPTLLGESLHKVLRAACDHLPQTTLHVLTNGRLFADRTFTSTFNDVKGRVAWAVPLYADTRARHDYVVQAEAFDDTIAGIYNLAEQGHSIEIRLVLHRETVPRLYQFAEFLWRTMPFVSHVALMGLEPMGYARQNRGILWIDPLDYADDLARAVAYLEQRGMAVSVYNVPRCVLPRPLWPFARRSISDWKNSFIDECNACDEKENCCGFFRSADASWRSRGVRSIREGVTQ